MVGPNRWFTLASSLDGEYAGNAGFTIGPDRSGFCTRPETGTFSGCPSPHANIYDNIDGWVAQYQPDVITLMIGANDQFPESLEPGETGAFRDVTKSEGAAKLEALVNKLRRIAPNAQIVLGGLSRVAYTTDTPEMAAIRFTAQRIAEESVSDNVTFANIWSAELTGADFADTLHYSDEGAAKVAAVWYTVVKAAIEKVN
jgi:lysophospholipase L1-like esterase